MNRNALRNFFEAVTRALPWLATALALCLSLNQAQARPAALVGSDAKPKMALTVLMAVAKKKEVPSAGGQTKDRTPKTNKKPRCADVGGYEVYMRRTGRVCMIGAEGYQGPEYRGGR